MNKITIIAEMGINHNGDMELAKNMITIAKKVGATAIKTQLYEVDKLFPDKQIIAGGRDWYEEVKKTELTYEQVAWLAAYAKTIGIEFLASAFDTERVAWLEEIEVRRHKVGSRANKDKELIDAMAETGKPIIISTNYPIDFYYPKNASLGNLFVLYCIPHYPTNLSELKFKDVDFNYHYDGFSDHTIGIEASLVAIVRGAKIIEKHFCLKRDDSNPDMVCSIEPDELKQLVNFARKVEEAL